MTANELELVNLLSEAKDLENAVRIFADIIDFLKQNGTSEEQASEFLRKNYQVTLCSC